MDSEPTPSDLIAQRVHDLRKGRGMTIKDLAARCKAAGMPRLTTQVLYKLEGQRANRAPRPVSVDELLVLAYVLDIAPVYLITGREDDDEACPVTPSLSVDALSARSWIRGIGGLPGTDEQRYISNMAVSEIASGYFGGHAASSIDDAIAALDSFRAELSAARNLREVMAAARAELGAEIEAAAGKAQALNEARAQREEG